MPYINVDTEVWFDLDELSDDDLIEELESRGYDLKHLPCLKSNSGSFDDILIAANTVTINKLIEAKKYAPEKFDAMFAEWVYQNYGKVV